MAKQNRDIVVNIISDASQFLKGYEQAIAELEKYTKKADIASGMQAQIDDVKESIKQMSYALQHVSTGKIDTRQLDKLGEKLNQQIERIDYLYKNNKKIKLEVDKASGKGFENIIASASSLLDNLHQKVEMLHNVGININTHSVAETNKRLAELGDEFKELIGLKNKLNATSLKDLGLDGIDSKSAVKELQKLQTEYHELQQKIEDATWDEEAEKFAMELGVVSKKMLALRDQFDIKTKFKLIDISALQDDIKAAQKINNEFGLRTKAELESLKKTLTDVVHVYFKDGKLTVPLEVESNINQLKQQATYLVQEVQEAMWKTPIMVPLKFTSSYITKAKDELKGLESTVNSLGDGDKKAAIVTQIENLKKQLKERDFRVDFKTNIDTLNSAINGELVKIQDTLKKARLYLYPEVTIDEGSQKKIQDTLNAICKSLQIDLSSLGLNIEKIFGEEERKQLQEAVKDIKIELTPSVKLTQKDVDKINKKLITELQKLKLEVDVSKLESDLKHALNTSLIDNWGNKFISTIDQVCRKIDNSFGKLSQNQFYETMKGWSEADKIMRDYRRGSTKSNTVYATGASGELERKAYINSKRGTVSNAYIVDQLGSVSGEIKQQLKSLYSGIKQIGDIYDTTLHSHPVHSYEQLSFSKVLGNNTAKKQIGSLITDSIVSQIASNNTKIDQAELSKQLTASIKSLYADVLKTKPSTVDNFIPLFNQKLKELLDTAFDGKLQANGIALTADTLYDAAKRSVKGREREYFTTYRKGIGADLTFSDVDLLSYNNERLNEGIKKLMIESNGMINELDLSTVDDRIVAAIVKEYQANLSKTLTSVQGQYKSVDTNGVDIVDYTKRAEFANKLLSDIITKQITAGNKKYKTNYSTDASQYLKQYSIDELKVTPDNVNTETQEVSQLVQLLNQMSTSLSEINKKDIKFDTKSLDSISKKLTDLLKTLKEINVQIGNVKFDNVNISTEPIDRIVAVLTNLSNMFQRAFNVASDSDIENQWEKLQQQFNSFAKDDGNFDARKKAVSELIAEYQKYVDMGGKDPITALTANKKGQQKLETQYSRYVEEQAKAAQESAKAVEEENKSLAQTKKVATEAAEAKGKFTKENKKVDQAAEQSTESIQKEAAAIRDVEQATAGNVTTSNDIVPVGSVIDHTVNETHEMTALAVTDAQIIARAEDIKQTAYEETADALDVLRKAQVGTAEIFEEAQSSFDFTNPHLAKKAFFEEYARMIRESEGFAESKYTINTDAWGEFKSANVEYYNKALKQTIVETWEWHKANKKIMGDTDKMVITNIKHVDNVKSYYAQIEKDNKKMADELQKVKNSLAQFDSETQHSLTGNAQYQELSQLLANGFSDLKDVERANQLMIELDTHLKGIKADARKGSKSFDIFSNMVEGISEADNKVKLLQIDFNALTDAPQDLVDTFSKLNSALNTLKSAKSVEEQAKAYGDYRVALNDAAYALRIFKREQSVNDKVTMSYQKDMLLYENVETQKLQLRNLEETLKSSGLLTDELKAKFAQLNTELSNVGSVYENNLWRKSFQQLKLDVAETTNLEKKRSNILKEIVTLSNQIATKQAKVKLLDITTDIAEIRQLQDEINVLQMKLDGKQDLFTNLYGDSGVDATTIAELAAVWGKVEAAEEKALNKEAFDAAKKDYSELKTTLTEIVAVKERLAKATINGDSFSVDVLSKELSRLEDHADKINRSLVDNVRGWNIIDFNDLAKLDTITASFEAKLAPLKDKQLVDLTSLHDQLRNAGLLTDELAQRFENLVQSLASVSDNNTLTNWVAEFTQLQSAFPKELTDGFAKIGQNFNLLPNDDGKIDLYAARVQNIRDAINGLRQSVVQLDTTDDTLYTDGVLDAQKYNERIRGILQSISDLKQVSASYNISNTEGKYKGTLLTDSVGNVDNLDDVLSALREYADLNNLGKEIGHQMSAETNKASISFKNQDGVITKLNATLVQFTDASGNATYGIRMMSNTTEGAMGLFGNFGASLKKFAGTFTAYISGYQLATRIISQFRQGIGIIREFDAAMTELIKVSNDAESALWAFEQQAFDIAETIGSTGKEIINSAADWEKLGYAIADASVLARNSALYANVGDMEIDTATEHLISTLQAFNIEAQDSITIVDKFNEVGNNYAITSEGIGAALERSAASFNAANTNLDKSIALITGTNAVIQNSEKVGNMWATVSARIRGSKQELEDLGEETDKYVTSSSKLRDMVMGVTGFDIMEDENTYKDVYEIIIGIGKVWDELSDIDRAGLLEALAGKRQSNALAAALNNVKMIEEVYQSSLDAEGSALEENKRYLESIQGHLDKLTNQWQEMWATEINRDAINGFIDLGTNLLGLVDKIGVVRSALIALFSVMSLKNGGTIFKVVGEDIQFMGVKLGTTSASFKSLKDGGMKSLTALKTAIAQTTSQINAASIATKIWAGFLNILASIGIGLFVSALVNGITKLAEKSSQLKESVESVVQTFTEFQDTVNNNTKTITNLSDKYEALSNKISKFGGKIGLTSAEYDEYLDICNQVASIMPELVSYYDDEGNAVIKLTDNVNNLAEAYRKKTQAQAESLLSNNDIKDVNENYQNFFKGSGNSSDLSRLTPWAPWKNWDNYKLNFVQTYFTNSTARKWFDISNYEGLYGEDTVRQWLKQWSTMTHQELVDFVNSDATHDMKNYLNKMLFDIGYDDGIIDGDNFNQLHDELIKQLSVLEGDVSDRVTSIKAVLNQIVAGNMDYADIDNTDIRNGIKRFISVIDDEFINANNMYNEAGQRDFIYSFIDTLVANEDELVRSFANFTTDMTLDATNQALKQLESKLGYDSNLLAAFFGLSYSDELYDEYVNFVDTAARQTLSGEDYSTAFHQIKEFFKDNSINTQEELNKFRDVWVNAAYDLDKAFTNYVTVIKESSVFSISDYETDINDFQSLISSLGSTLSKLQDGSITDGELIDLAQEFTEIDIASETLEQDIKDLIDEALNDLLDSMENPPEGLVKLLESLAEEAKNATEQIQSLADGLADLEDKAQLRNSFKDIKNAGKALDVSTLQDIVKTYPQLESAVAGYLAGLVSVDELYQSFDELYQSDLSVYAEYLAVKNQDNEQYYRNLLGYLSDDIINKGNSYGVDLKNYKSYGEAKLALDAELAKKRALLARKEAASNSSQAKYEQTVKEADAGLRLNPSISALDEMLDAEVEVEETKAELEEFEKWLESFDKSLQLSFSFDTLFGQVSSSDAVDKELEIFDWYETVIERLERDIEHKNLDEIIDDETKSLEERNKALAEQIELTKQVRDTNKKAAAAWEAEFNKAVKESGLSQKDVNKIKDGTLALETLDPNKESDAKKIEAYEKLIPIYETYLKYKDAEIQKEEELADLLETRLEDTLDIYNLIERKMTRLSRVVENYMALVDNTFLNYGSRLSNLSMAMTAQKDHQMPILEKNIQYWKDKAEEFDLDDYTKSQIRFGANAVWDDKTPEQIEKYKEYAEILDELNSAEDALRDAQKSYRDNYRLKFDLLDSQFSDQVGDITQDITKLNSALENAAYTGEDKTALLDQIAQKNLEIAETADFAAESLKKMIDQLLKDNIIMKDSQEHQALLDILEGWQNQSDEARLEAKNTYAEAMNVVAAKYDRILSDYEQRAQIIETNLSKAEAKGHIANTKYYDQLISNELDVLGTQYAKQAALKAELADIMQKNPDLAEGSDKWHELNDAIEAVNIEIANGELALINYANALRQIGWDTFDFLHDQISIITNEADFLIALMEKKKLYEDNGQLTDTGLAIMGQHGLNYNVYVNQAAQYAKEIARINADLAKEENKNDTNMIARKNELIATYQDYILAAEDTKYAIIDMVEEGINLELESLQTLIDEYKEALEAQKDLYDYQKKVTNQTKTIAQLQKQLAAYENDKSEEARAKIQQIRVQLDEAQEDLDDTNYDHYMSEQEELLTSLYESYETVLNQRLDNVDTLFEEMIADINANSDTIAQTIQTESDKVGYQISDVLIDIWNAESFEIQGATQDIVSSMSDTSSLLSDIDDILFNLNTRYQQEIEQNAQHQLEKDAYNKSTYYVLSDLYTVADSINTSLEGYTSYMLEHYVDYIYTSWSQMTDLVVYIANLLVEMSGNISGLGDSFSDSLNGIISSIPTTPSTPSTNTDGSSGGSGSSSGGTSSGGSSGGSSSSSSTSSTKNQVNFKYKKNYVPLSKLDVEHSIEDRLKMHNYDESFTARKQYYKEMGYSDNYYGTDIQNMRMLKWMKANGYAKGARRIGDDEVAWTQENGQEYIIRPSDGAILTPLAQGDSVLTAEATQHLWEMANNPSQFIKDNMLMSANVPNVRGYMSAGAVETNMEVQFVLPNVSDYHSFITQMQKDKKFEKMVQDMTINQLSGGSQMAKYKYKF